MWTFGWGFWEFIVFFILKGRESQQAQAFVFIPAWNVGEVSGSGAAIL